MHCWFSFVEFTEEDICVFCMEQLDVSHILRRSIMDVISQTWALIKDKELYIKYTESD